MKKLFVLMAAAFAMVACQTDINEVGVAGGEVNVTFEVGTPTRAYSDGTTATVLQYAVYEGTEELRNLTVTDGEIHGSTKVELQLVTGNEYTVIFWAAAPDAPYSVDWATGTMTVNYNGAVCNAENRDAFYKRHTFTVKGAQTETIELRRPFAQLNIGTNDYTAATEAGYTPVNSAVKVTNVYKTLNLWNGAVSTPVEVNFDYNTIAKTETFPVTGYQYLAMNYLLVNSEKEVVDIEFGYTESDATVAKTRTVGSVPVQRNYRTNIYGQLLTSDVDINIVIKPEYEDEHNVESGLFSQVADVVGLQEAIDAAPVGELTTIILTEDLDLSATRALGYITRVENGSNIVIDGNGHTINGQIRIKGQSVWGNETTVIRNINFVSEAEGMEFIWSNDSANGSYWRYANNVTVENCTFTANGAAAKTAVAVKFQQARNITVKNCEGTNLHSLCQFQSNDTDIVLEGLKAVNCKNGISLGTTKKVTINGLEIDAKEYGLRVDGHSLQSGTRCSLSVENATITAMQPIVARKVTAGYDLTLGEEVVLNTEELHQVVFTTTSDDVRPYVAPAKGKYTYSSAADFVVFPVVEVTDAVKDAEGLFYSASKKTYFVANAEGLIAVSASGKIKAGNTVALIADIDLAGKEFNGLDTFHPEQGTTFDGQGHTVSNWTNESGASDMGFIRNWVGPVKNVTIKNATLKTNGRSAIVAAKIYGNIEECHVVDCKIVDTYWACGLIAGLYNAGKIENCTVTGSYVETNGGAGGIVGVINEEGGNRGVNYCSVSNTTVNNKGGYGEIYSGGLICGMINVNNATIEFKGNTLENNTKLGKYVGDLYYNAEGNTIVTE